MSFWTYMLHCRGGYFYVGHTDDLEKRIGQHQSGFIPGFTADHQPVELVWSEEFQTREDAKAAERKLKGWSRAKKLALIRGDWELISALAKKKGDASTGSAQTGLGEGESPEIDHPETAKTVRPELVEASLFSLQPHPTSPPLAIMHITARIIRIDERWLTLRWRIEGSERIAIPPFSGKGRADNLWQTTCFELFVCTGEGGAYAEFNLSPTEQWAAYDFTSYREGMAQRPMPRDPVCTLRHGRNLLIFDAAIPRAGLPDLPWRFGLSAIIEETGGHKSYWALAHPPGKPDFHRPTCFAAALPAPVAA